MKEIKYVITDPLGLHARPAGQLVKAASACACDVKLLVKGAEADAKRIMGVMRLAAKKGDELTLRCSGADEAEAASKLEAFLKANL